MRLIITGITRIGENIRLILFPDEIVRKKKCFNLMDIAKTGDPSEMQRQAITEALIANNPPSIIISDDEFFNGKYQIDDHINIKFEKE